jgi:hypothetical protein
MMFGLKPAQIDPGLAVSLAGQVGAGLLRNREPERTSSDPDDSRDVWIAELEEANQRARGALVAIGLMVRNADRTGQAGRILEELEAAGAFGGEQR